MSFINAIKTRRTVYHLGRKLPVAAEAVRSIVEEAVLHSPSAFNSQSSRVVILEGKAHEELWDATLEILRPMVGDAEAFKQTQGRIGAFRAAAGTVLFFEDQAVVKGLQENFALYKDNFPVWSQQSSGMAQFAVWTALAAEGIGANLQHYNPLVDAWVAQKTGVPQTWKLMAQMPFGSIETPAGQKEFAPVEQRVKVVA